MAQDNPLAQCKAMVVVFAMAGCPACEDYKPRFERMVDGFRRAPHNLPFVWYRPGAPIARGQIPVMILDAASQDPSIVEFANQHGIEGLPSTVLFTHNRPPVKLEGAIDDGELYQCLASAVYANR